MSKRIASKEFGGADVRDYEASGSLQDLLPYPRWVGIRVPKSLFTAGASTEEVNLATIPAGTTIHAVEVDVVEEYSHGTPLTAATLILGDTVVNDPNGLIGALADLDETAGPTLGLQRIDITEYGVHLYDATKKSLTPYIYTAADILSASMTINAGDVADLTGGEVIVYLLASSVGAGRVFKAQDSEILDS